MVSCGPENEERLRRLAADYGVTCTRIGTVTGEGVPLSIETASSALRFELDVLRGRYFGAIPGIMNEAGQ